MPGRSFVGADGYRYGFNGKEKTDEVSGNGNNYDYGYRIYNPRLGKFLSVDPLSNSYPWNSTYAFAENDVIRSIDLDGLEKFIVHQYYNKNNEVTRIIISRVEDLCGDEQDTDLKRGGKDATTKDVMLIHHYPTKTETTFEIALNEAQNEVADHSIVFNEKMGDGKGELKGNFTFVGGEFSSEPFKEGVLKRSDRSFDKTPVFGGSKITKGVTLSGFKGSSNLYYGIGPLPGGPSQAGGVIGDVMKSSIKGLTATLNKAEDIKSITVTMILSVGTATTKSERDVATQHANIAVGNIIAEFKRNNLDKNINIINGGGSVVAGEKAPSNQGVNISIK
jgi:RHS repeat-associated protein